MTNVAFMKLYKYIWQTISAIGLIVGIVASALSIRAFYKVGDLTEFIDGILPLIISIEITNPTNEKNTDSFVVRVSGKVKFRTTPTGRDLELNTNLTLNTKNIELLQFVRPILKNECVWYLQSKPIVYQDGSFEGLAFLIDNSNSDMDVEHQIITVATPKGIVNDQLKYNELPSNIAVSNIVSLTKIK
jgi:hypothetical protein